MKVLVAGGGLSGLTAATEFQRLGCTAMVFEARSRVGGRIYSPSLSNGVVVEQGALNIRAVDHKVRRLCAELELPLIGHSFPIGRSEIGRGEEEPEDEFEGIFSAIAQRVVTRVSADESDESLTSSFRSIMGPVYWQHPAYLSLQSIFGTDVDKLSAAAFTNLYLDRSVFMSGGQLASGGSSPASPYPDYLEHQSHVYGGNQRICVELARKLREPVRFGASVISVDQTAHGVEFALDDGSTEIGDLAVIALPLALLRRLELGFALPDLMQTALDHLVVGNASTVSVELIEGAYPRCVQHPQQRWVTWNSARGDDEFTSVAAVSTYLGTEEVARHWLADGASSLVDELHRMRPELEFPTAPDVIITDWQREEWSSGAYPNWAVGWTPALDEAFSCRVVGRTALAGADTSGATMGEIGRAHV